MYQGLEVEVDSKNSSATRLCLRWMGNCFASGGAGVGYAAAEGKSESATLSEAGLTVDDLRHAPEYAGYVNSGRFFGKTASGCSEPPC